MPAAALAHDGGCKSKRLAFVFDLDFPTVRIPVIVSSDSGANVSSIPVIVSSVPGQREQDGRSLTLA